MMETSLSSTPPSADDADGGWRLMEIKEGVEIATHPLFQKETNKNQQQHQTVIRFGRAADQVDIVLAHDSCSRHHAEIRRDHEGALRPCLYDLNSTHGTKVNKQRIINSSSMVHQGNDETKTSGGVPLYPGDVLQFGASTRLFVVEGPVRWERDVGKNPPSTTTTTQPPKQQQQPNWSQQQKQRQQQKQLMQQEAATKTDDVDEESDNEGDEEEEEHPEAVVATIPLDISEVPEKHRKTWERLQAKRYKLSNLQTEQERIQVKSDLTTGQEQQLQRIAQRMTTLQDEMEETEADLLEKLQDSSSTSKRSQRSKRKKRGDDMDEDEDVDDFYDRTKHSSQHEDTAAESGETEESLTTKWKSLQSRHVHLSTTLTTASSKSAALQNNYNKAQQNNDHEQSFWIQNDLDLAREQVTKLQSNVKQVETSLTETERLLHIVNPKLIIDRQQGTIGRKEQLSSPPPPIAEPFQTSMAPPPPRSPVVVVPAKTSAGAMGDSTTTTSHSVLVESANEKMPPPPPSLFKIPQQPTKRQRIKGPSMPPPSATSLMNHAKGEETTGNDESVSTPVATQPKHTSNDNSASDQRRRHGAAPQGTLALLLDLTSTATEKAASMNTASGHDSSKHLPVPTKSTIAPSFFDAKKDEWRPPQGQDGSGVTKLNQKFAGRY